jgi:hypothetical protein
LDWEAFLIEYGLELQQLDVLEGFHCSSAGQREFVRVVALGTETYARTGNSGGKTKIGGATGISLARRLKALDQVELPDLGESNVGWILTQSYKQQLDASQKTYQELLGKHPHHIAYVVGTAKGYIETIYVAARKGLNSYVDQECEHGMGEHCERCSRIVFHCEESKSSVGGRIDWAHADEPPLQEVWHEIRWRKQAGKRLLLFITATPLARSRWYWISGEYDGSCVYESATLTGSTERKTEPAGDLAELRWTIYDNLALSDEDIAYFESKAKHDDFRDARLRGDYVDVSGTCPFHPKLLKANWVPRCRAPEKTEIITVLGERDTEDGRIVTAVRVELLTWWGYEEDEKYFVLLDPSAGIKDKDHDPAALHVYARRKPRLVALYNGYVGAYGLGSLAAKVGARYGKALVDVEMGGGYGGPVLTALNAASYRHVAKDVDVDKPGVAPNLRLGFRVSHSNRGEILGSIEQAVLEDSIVIPSYDVVSCLLNVVVDEHDKVKAAPGRHDEHMILLGRALYLMQMRKPGKLRPKSGIRDAFERSFGRQIFARHPQPVAERWSR